MWVIKRLFKSSRVSLASYRKYRCFFASVLSLLRSRVKLSRQFSRIKFVTIQRADCGERGNKCASQRNAALNRAHI